MPAGFLVLVSGAAPVFAQAAAARPWHVTAFVGTGYGGDLRDTLLAVGAAVDREWRPRISGEAEFGFVSNVGQPGADISALTAAASLLVHAVSTRRAFVPYVVGGGALVRIEGRPGTPDGAPVTAAALILGAGGTARFARRLGIRGDVRYVHVNDAPNFWRAYAGLVVKFR